VEGHHIERTQEAVGSLVLAYCDICSQRFTDVGLTAMEKWAEGVDADFLVLVLRLMGSDEDEDDRDNLYCLDCEENTLHRLCDEKPTQTRGGEELACTVCGHIRWGRFRLEKDGTVVDVDRRVSYSGNALGDGGYDGGTGTYYKGSGPGVRHW